MEWFEDELPKVKYSDDAMRKLTHTFGVDRDVLLSTDTTDFIKEMIRKEITSKYGPLALIESITTETEWTISDDSAKIIVTIRVPKEN